MCGYKCTLVGRSIKRNSKGHSYYDWCNFGRQRTCSQALRCQAQAFRICKNDKD